MKSLLKNILQGILNNSKKRPAQSEIGLVGICVEGANISMAYVQGNEVGNLVVKAHDYKHARDPDVRDKALRDFVQKYGLIGYPCCYLLSSSDYVLGLIEAPNVAKEEKVEAVRWMIKEFIDYSVEQANIDLFELPLVRASDNVKMAYVAIMQNKLIEDIEKTVLNSGLELRYIDIQELVLRNLSMLHPENIKGALFLRLFRDGGNVVITRKDELFISRKTDLELSSFLITEEYISKDIVTDDEILDKLALDVQRSMDYCSGMFRHSPANAIILSPSELDIPLIEQYLSKNLGMDVFSLDLSEHIWFEQKTSKEEQKNCLMAIGAAMYNVSLIG